MIGGRPELIGLWSLTGWSGRQADKTTAGQNNPPMTND
jgi:hypothetical protein